MEQQNKTILVVDDDLETVDLARRILEHAGYHVLFTTDPRQAVKMALSQTPAVALVDTVMPELNGNEVTTQILAQGRVTQVIVMSGFAESIKVLDAYQYGASDYVLKPFQGVQELLQAIERGLERYHRWRKMILEANRLHK